MNYKFEIFSFKAIDRPDLCDIYIDKHSGLLKDYGITKLTSADSKWCQNPESYVLMVRDSENKEFIAGARIDIKNDDFKLPIEDAISQIDTQIHDFAMKMKLEGGVGEICGLWISKDYLGLGLAVILLRADISLATPLSVKTLFFLCSDNTKNMLKNMGCILETSIGNKGTFYYPKLDLIATFLILPDTNKLEFAKGTDRERIINLRENPNQIFLEEGLKHKISVTYSLDEFKLNTLN